MKCEGFAQITKILMDYLDNNRLIAHYCRFSIVRAAAVYWTYDPFLRKLRQQCVRKEIMAAQVKRSSDEMGIVDASFIYLDSTPVAANTKAEQPEILLKKQILRKTTSLPGLRPRCPLGLNQHNERRYEFYWGYKSHVLVDC